MLDESQVINQDTNQPDGKVQPDVAPEPEVLVQAGDSTPKNMYTSAVRPIQEANHADDIAANVLKDQQTATATFNTTRQAETNYNTDVNTSTTMSNNAELNGTFKSYYGMGDKYKAQEGEDFSWNKLAKESAYLSYKQQEAQARYESMEAKQELNKSERAAFNNYFAAMASAKQTQDKMGWTGGQQTASDLQVQFLQAETAANMYTQEEMQRYGVESKLSIARMYAAAEQRAKALEYYQDAVNLAVQQANETGCYVPPEASEMMKQETIADGILKNKSNYTQDQINRAKNVKKYAQDYYDALGFQRWDVPDDNGKTVTTYYGIKTLQKLEHEETLRSNAANEELQRIANNNAARANAINASQLRTANYNQRMDWARQNQIDIAEYTAENRKESAGENAYYYEDKITYDEYGGIKSVKRVKHSLPKGTEVYTKGTGEGQTYMYIVNDGSEQKGYQVYMPNKPAVTEKTTTVTETDKTIKKNEERPSGTYTAAGQNRVAVNDKNKKTTTTVATGSIRSKQAGGSTG